MIWFVALFIIGGVIVIKETAPLNAIDALALDIARDRLIKNEGYSNIVYLDSLGKPTVGIGHLVTPFDNLKVGDEITDKQVIEFFNRDIQKAFFHARIQAHELKKGDNPEFIAALVEVNFQLGTGWRNVFPNTWKALRSGDIATAINNLRKSLWASQTPKRVVNFIDEIEQAWRV